MNKSTLRIALSIAATLFVFTLTYAQELAKDTIKHELARMSEQASWTVERWNINNVEFEFKEISRETRNQPARFEFNIKFDEVVKKINPVSRFIESNKISRNEITKNKILYKNVYEAFAGKSILNKEYWNIIDLQLKLVDGVNPKSMNKNSRFYQNFTYSDFPNLMWLVQKSFFLGEAVIEGEMYLIYRCLFDDKLKDMDFEIYEYKFNMERAGNGDNINYEKLATLPSIEELLEDKFSYIAIINKKTKLPLYYFDCITLRKYKLSEDYQAVEVPTSVQKYVQWYIENVLPKLERRAQKATN